MLLEDGKHWSYISFIWNQVVRIKSLQDKAEMEMRIIETQIQET